MREIEVERITEAVTELCIKACLYLGDDVVALLRKARAEESSDFGVYALDCLLENLEIAAQEQIPICQDTGMTVVFLEIGQDLHLVGGDLTEAVNAGVRRGYREGYLRKSVLSPLTRINTDDNTPAVIHTRIVPGNRLKITVAPKGAGSENMSRLKMLKPADGLDGIKQFVLDTVLTAGGSPCPPLILGIGIGGTMEKAALLAKEAILRKAGTPTPDPEVAQLEAEILALDNQTGIGPQGPAEGDGASGPYRDPTHIAELGRREHQCHAARRKK